MLLLLLLLLLPLLLQLLVTSGEVIALRDASADARDTVP
jgi:hypothetical protein